MGILWLFSNRIIDTPVVIFVPTTKYRSFIGHTIGPCLIMHYMDKWCWMLRIIVRHKWWCFIVILSTWWFELSNRELIAWVLDIIPMHDIKERLTFPFDRCSKAKSNLNLWRKNAVLRMFNCSQPGPCAICVNRTKRIKNSNRANSRLPTIYLADT